ncbi:phasin family protein [Vreelandella arcis]|uniref:Phasin family protein n=1 Tax=Vreelandella arcis TaxID=416873 RepID=A0A1H0F6Q8_9GAMM|nr:phasin family protein [Halomonas arcis]SDN90324.1 phasin family protein [Halomonas arcis]
MSTFNTNEWTQQFDNIFMAPARAYAALSVDMTEKFFNAQLDAQKAYVDTSLSQARQLMSVKDAEGLRSYMEGQQKVAKEVAERLKSDADNVVSLQKDFVQQTQKITEDNIKQAKTAASKMGNTA